MNFSRGVISRVALAAFSCVSFAFCQPAANYQVATITEVQVHKAESEPTPEVVSYDVSVKVGTTVYVVLYTPRLGENTVKYAAGRDLLVLVGKKAITYNDILGRSFEVPIISQKVVAAKQPQ